MINFCDGMAWLYLLVSTVFAPIVCLVMFLAVAQAAKRRLRAYLKWLIPLAVGSALDAVGILLLSITNVLQIHSPAIIAIQALSYTVATAGVLFGYYAVIALWRMVKALPPYLQPTETSDQPPDSQIWPPAPNRP